MMKNIFNILIKTLKLKQAKQDNFEQMCLWNDTSRLWSVFLDKAVKASINSQSAK